MEPDVIDKWHDEYGNHIGYCDSCGEEAQIGQACCDDGEVVPYDDDPGEG